MWATTTLAEKKRASLPVKHRAHSQAAEKSMPKRMRLKRQVATDSRGLTIITGHFSLVITPSTVLPTLPLTRTTPF